MPPPAALALDVAPEVALFMLSAAPLPELAAPDTVAEDALDVVFVAAMLELLTSRCNTSQRNNRHGNQRLFHDHSFE
jgi:hypothetical protein